MTRARALAIAVAAVAVGCGLPDPPGFGGNVQGGETKTLALTSFAVAPGAEVYKCQTFANPFGGSVDIDRFESHMTPGSHHLLVFFKDGASDDALESCSGLEFAPGPYGSQRPDDALDYPSGVAVPLSRTRGLRLQAHYLNASTAPLQVSVSVTIRVAKPGAIGNRAGVIFFNNLDLDIAPGTSTVEKSCLVPYEVKMIRAAGHMHQHGVRFLARSGSTTLFETTEWGDVQPALFDPPRTIAGGSRIEFSCTYQNDTGMNLRFGESARSDEMCVFTGQFYPSLGDGLSCI